MLLRLLMCLAQMSLEHLTAMESVAAGLYGLAVLSSRRRTV